MAREVKQPFLPSPNEYVVGRPFVFHGHAYSSGNAFPWRELSCSVRKLRQLFEQRYIKAPAVEPKLVDGKGGWWSVEFMGQSERFQGREKAEARIRELNRL